MTEEPKTYADKLLLGLQRIEEGQRILGRGPASFWIEQVKAEVRPFWEEQLKIALQALEDSRVENASLLAEQAATEPSDEEIEAGYYDWRRDGMIPGASIGPKEGFAAGVTFMLQRHIDDEGRFQFCEREQAPNRLAYSDPPWGVAYAHVDPQPVAVWEPTPAFPSTEEAMTELYRLTGDIKTNQVWGWMNCYRWLRAVLHPQPPEPEDTGFEVWWRNHSSIIGNSRPDNHMAMLTARAAWNAARGEQPS